MKLLDILTAPWAIVPEKLTEIQAIYLTHLRGEKIDIAGIEARLGRPLSNEQRPYEIVDGVAVISVEGVIAKRMNFFMRISGGASTSFVRSQIAQALDDPEVKAILLDIDSPGGAVDGTAELAEMVYNGREKMPIVAYTDGMMCSAAYWIGAAAHKVLISGNTVQIGSIGVVAAHVDISAAEHERGIRTTEIVAGKYKRIASHYVPLSPEGRQTIQDQVNHIYSVFVGDVAKFRGVSEEVALEKMADGRIFVGRQAMEAGLVDGVSTREYALALAVSDEMLALCSPDERERKGMRSEAGAASVEVNLQIGGRSVDPDKAGAEFMRALRSAGAVAPGVSTDETKGDVMKVKIGERVLEIEGDTLTLDAAFVGSNAPEVAAALRSEGMTAERERILGIEKNALPGYEKIVADAKADGKSTGADVAVRIVEAERSLRTQKAKDIETDAVKPVPAAAPPVDEAAKTKEDKKTAAIKAYKDANPKASDRDALLGAAAANPELFRD